MDTYIKRELYIAFNIHISIAYRREIEIAIIIVIIFIIILWVVVIRSFKANTWTVPDKGSLTTIPKPLLTWDLHFRLKFWSGMSSVFRSWIIQTRQPFGVITTELQTHNEGTADKAGTSQDICRLSCDENVTSQLSFFKCFLLLLTIIFLRTGTV